MTDASKPQRHADRIDVHQHYELCAWARHFMTSEHRVKEAVAAVGDSADRVRDHLTRHSVSGAPTRRSGDRPSAR
jgi:hypothetical protein